MDMQTSIHLIMELGTPIVLKPERMNSQLTVSKAFLVSIFKAHLDIVLDK
jgi:hypothetical protein